MCQVIEVMSELFCDPELLHLIKIFLEAVRIKDAIGTELESLTRAVVRISVSYTWATTYS
jgi:hypothetical protein